MNTFFETIFPTLLPFFLCTYLLLETNLLEFLTYLLQYISMPIFKLNGYGCLVVVVSIFTGTPFVASLISSFLIQNKISKKEALVLASCCLYPSWSFIYLTIGSFIGFSSSKVLCLSIYFSSFLLLFILSNILLKKEKFVSFKEVKNNIRFSLLNFNFPLILRKTIINSCTNLIVILGTMVYFSLPLTVFKNNLFIQALFEFSSASFAIINSTISHKISYLAFTFSFGSLSLIMQHHSMLEDTGIKIKHLLLSRLFIIPFTFLFLKLLT
ncbi:MAG: hypothetical protein E7184_01590 [Erysipelotrichaceae bacterium]|nr:hypothetical protein [Erysipelotrichaceae bacterium]